MHKRLPFLSLMLILNSGLKATGFVNTFLQAKHTKMKEPLFITSDGRYINKKTMEEEKKWEEEDNELIKSFVFIQKESLNNQRPKPAYSAKLWGVTGPIKQNSKSTFLHYFYFFNYLR